MRDDDDAYLWDDFCKERKSDSEHSKFDSIPAKLFI